MTYELAKQLKDAGFKVESHDCWERGCQSNNGACYPTLSELLEECGSPIYIHSNTNGYWYACTGLHSDALRVEGKTPEEVVALLWLKLDKKSS